MTMALAEAGDGAGVTVAEVDLKPVWDVISQVRIGQSGYAYVVDSGGRLIAHPDIDLVLQQTDLSLSPQVQAARSGTLQGRQRLGSQEAVDLLGQSVLVVSQIDRQRFFGDTGESSDRLVAYEAIDPPGWAIFVDQSLEEAFAPVRAALARTVLLLLMGLVIAVLASLFLVRRMLAPIQALQAGAARIGEGALDQRIEVRTGDEHEALAEQFNTMAGQLQESYANLEQKVEERTRDLAAALEQRDRLLREVEETSRQLAEVSRHKSEFLANMSHELRTPLNAIIGFSEVLVEKMFGELNDRQEEYLNDILSSGKHLLSLINDILDLSKVEAGQMELESGQFSVREALENGLTMLKERASRHGISLGLEIDPDLHLIEADERKVKQVVFNLLSNAVKFTPDGGRIEVTAHQLDSEIRIAVRDTGIGIAPEDQERIFEEFRQVGQGSAKAEGTGLGLALTRKLVELHGGRIWVESELGVGSTFTFALPLRRAEASGSLSAPSSAASS